MTQNKKTMLNLHKAKTPITLDELSKDAKTPLMFKVEARLGKDIREFLRQNYIEKGLPWEKIAKTARVSPKTLWVWGKKFGIKSRPVPNSKPETVEKSFRNASGYKHIVRCLCLTCQETSSKCGYTSTHKKGYCMAYCENYKWNQSQ